MTVAPNPAAETAAPPPPGTLPDTLPDTLPEAPWHRGELRLQEALGVREQMDAAGRSLVRPWMPDQHRDFFAQLPFLLVGTVDDADRPWAALLTGRPGFAQSPDPRSLDIAAGLAQTDPAAAGLAAGASIGLLGVDLATRRRNRVNGSVTARDGQTLRFAVEHSYGNCPQYIQTRAVDIAAEPDAPIEAPAETSAALTDAARAIIARADAFFVASYVDREGVAAGRQVDVSHRGGKAGFVRIGDDDALTIPDFAGNLHFNTLGNILETGKAGLLFVDFETGDLLQLTGAAEVILDSPEIAAFQGAERLWTVRPEHVVLRRAAIPLRWRFQDWSPNSLMTGDWDQAAARLDADAKRLEWRAFEVAAIRDEAAEIRSFELIPADGVSAAVFEAGQHLPIRLPDAAADRPVLRAYTLSSAPADPRYRISVKRDGRASTWLHERLRVGDRIEAQAPRGRFTIDAAETRPVALISAGVGVTPMLSMLRHLVYEGARTRHMRPTWFIHGARTVAERPFDAEIAALADASHGRARIVSALSRPEPSAAPGRDFHTEGRVNVELLKSVLPFDDFDFYLCGPGAFVQELYDGLRALGVRDARIFAEAFGPSALTRRPDASAAAPVDAPKPSETAVKVAFTESAKEARWTPESGALLELAEARGLAPTFSCRSGVCGACRTKLAAGAVAYPTPPSAEIGPDEALICCAVPAEGSEPLALKI